MRSAESQWNAETLRVSDGNVDAEFARRFQQCQCKNIRRDDHECPRIVCLSHKTGVIVNRAIGGGVLNERSKDGLIEFKARIIGDLYLDSERLRARLDDGDCLRMTIICDEERFPIWRDGVTQCHGFRSGGGFV